MPTGLAGALRAEGAVSSRHALGTLFDLALRGFVRIDEDAARKLGSQRFHVDRIGGRSESLLPHEAAVLAAVFPSAASPSAALGDRRVPLSKAGKRLHKSMRPYKVAVRRELISRRLVDPVRQHARRTLQQQSLAVLLVAIAAFAVGLAFVRTYDGWPLLISLGLGVAGLVGVVLASTISPLTDEGHRQSVKLGGFERHLRAVAGSREQPLMPDAFERYLPFAVALGLVSKWGAYLQRAAAQKPVPTWFRAAATHHAPDTGASLAAMLTSVAQASGAQPHPHAH